MALVYLSGVISQTLLADVRADVGVMYQPGMGNDPKAFGAWRQFALDNGRFARPEAWDGGEWLAWLASLRQYRANCLFAVLPDTVADAAATWTLSLPYVETVRQLGYVPAYVSQDGETRWPDGVGALFIGGSDAWKLSEDSYALAARARGAGLHVHMGRVNSLQRLRAAKTALIDSADGTFLRFGPDVNWGRLCAYLDEVNGQMTLEAAA